MSLIDIHSRLGNTALFYAIIMAVWGLWRFFRRQGVDSSYSGALVIAEILIVLQGAVGFFLLFRGAQQHFMHILYGIVAILIIPGIFAYTKGDEHRRAMLLYGVGCLFLIGILLRATMTG